MKVRRFELCNAPFCKFFFCFSKVRFTSSLGDMILNRLGYAKAKEFFDCFAKELKFWQVFPSFFLIIFHLLSQGL